MYKFLTLIFLFSATLVFSQEVRESYNANKSYDMQFQKLVKDDKGEELRKLTIDSRIYYSDDKDFVIIEQISGKENSTLELSIIDFKLGMQLFMKDKATGEAILKPYSKKEIPSYMRQDFTFEDIDKYEKDGMSIVKSKYIEEGRMKVEADVEITEYIQAPSYLEWMPLIQKDLDSNFPLYLSHKSEFKGMLNETVIKTNNFNNNQPFNFSTIDLNFN